MRKPRRFLDHIEHGMWERVWSHDSNFRDKDDDEKNHHVQNKLKPLPPTIIMNGLK